MTQLSDNAAQRLPIESLAPNLERFEQFRALYPDAFVEGKLDVDKLRQILGEDVDLGPERYGLTWRGKSDAIKAIQTLSTGTLLPCRDESVNFGATGNIIIEGDNLEVLKLLQRSYYDKIKMIYIDPPYNTGGEFIYPDNYKEGLQEYLRFSGQISGDGIKLTTNPETSGRYHSRWLTMMYPRLFLARNLLREDGVIFISVDDNEVSNLRTMCDEIFGEENFIGLFVVNSSPSAIDYGHIAKMHDYVLFYAKAIDATATGQLPEQDKEFKYGDKTGPFNIYPLYHGNVAFNPKTRPNLYYPFYLNPRGKIERDFYEIGLEAREGWVQVYPVVSKKDAIQRVWRWGKNLARQHLNQEIVGYKTEDGEFRVVQKTRHTGKVIRSLQLDKDISTRRGTAEVEELFGAKVFPFPKAAELIRRFIAVGLEEDGIVLDFFAGSGTTAHAVFKQNKADGVNRKFILVQLPEPTESKDYPTIADIMKERVRRVIKKLDEADAQELPAEGSSKPDRGFQVFKLSSSNFKIWDPETAPKDEAKLTEQLKLMVHNVVDKRSEDDLLYELILKSGLPLTSKIDRVTVAGLPAFNIENGTLIVCLARPITQEALREIIALKSTTRIMPRCRIRWQRSAQD